VSAAAKIPTPPPANDPPQLRTFEALAAELGFKNPRALRDWCKRRHVPYIRDGKFNWVDRNQVLAAIARGPVVHVAPAPAAPTVSSWVTGTLGVGGQRGS
jgi:hypothetical protein